MNLLIKLIYFFIVITLSKKILPDYYPEKNKQNLAMIGVIIVSNIIYRIFVNKYYEKDIDIIKIIKDSFMKTSVIIIGILGLNYLINNNTIANQYIDLPTFTSHTFTLYSLLPFIMYQAFLTPDILV